MKIYESFAAESSKRPEAAFRLREGFVAVVTALILNDTEMFTTELQRHSNVIQELKCGSLNKAVKDSVVELCKDWKAIEFSQLAEKIWMNPH